MAKGNAVWGIDIGQCALKGLRCTHDAKTGELVADAFDFIEYPKILTQPDADPESLVRDALKQFLSRNSVRGDKVAISVAGQQGLARFIKLPPVEAKKVPDIVKYEAKQQIPFALEDVIWDYQTLVGGGDSDGMALETEVGLFAMKRDQVFRAIRPLDDAGVELDVIQLSPICVYNAIVHSALGELPPASEYDPDNPPESVVVLSMGTETTDLVVTNGFRVWQRSIPLGGNHFTKQLTKELKLTFAKAEQLKRNSREAEDPKKIFQAMRSVFNDMVTEVQRSIGYFQSIDRSAKISRIVAMGNAFKLPGLEPYLEKNLGYKVQVIDSFDKLTGPAVVSSPAFKENVLSFGVCYGLALQGLGLAKLKTNLIPRELIRARMIREKKPWALAAVSLLLAGLGLSFLLHWNRWSQVNPEKYSSQSSQVQTVSSQSQQFVSTDTQDQARYDYLKALGDQVVGGAERRFMMLELVKAVNTALPVEPGLPPGKVSQLPLDERPVLYIDHVESQYFGGEEEDLSAWFTDDVKERYAQSLAILKGPPPGTAGQVEAPADSALQTSDAAAAPADGAPADAAPSDAPPANADPMADAVAASESPDADAESDPMADESSEEEGAEAVDVGELTGAGWVIELHGYHYHNNMKKVGPKSTGAEYVRNTLIRNLLTRKVELPTEKGPMEFSMEELGITYPILAFDGQLTLNDPASSVRNPEWEPPDPMAEDYQMAASQMGVGGIPGISPTPEAKKDKKKVEPFIKMRTHRFTVQFVWQPKPLGARLEERRLPQQQPDDTSTDDQVAGGF